MLTEYTRNRIATIVVASSDSLRLIISTGCCEFTLPKVILHRVLKMDGFERPLWCFSLPTLHRNDKNQLNITSLNWKPVYQIIQKHVSLLPLTWSWSCLVIFLLLLLFMFSWIIVIKYGSIFVKPNVSVLRQSTGKK